MEVIILRESGVEEALLGLSLSHNAALDRMPARADKLALLDGGHNKFLESVAVWLDIRAPRYWWQQFDTYRIGVTKQSESTMHTLMRRPLDADDFQGGCPAQILDFLNGAICRDDFVKVKNMLPESFIQRRIVTTNYKSLRHIVAQRYDHHLIEWQHFCHAVTQQVTNPQWLEGYK